jgi:hypothetical protein
MRTLAVLSNDENLKNREHFTRGFDRLYECMQNCRAPSKTPFEENEKDIEKSIREIYKAPDEIEESKTAYRPSAARQKAGYSQRQDWLKKRGIDIEGKDSVSFVKFLRKLFEALDDDRSDTLEPKELITHLLAVGIAPKASYIEKALLAIYHTDDINSINMSKHQFVDLFKKDKRTDLILEKLRVFTKEMIQKEEDQRLARIFASKDVAKDPTKKPGHSTGISISESMFSAGLSIFSQNKINRRGGIILEEKIDYNEHYDTKMKLKYCSMYDSSRLLKLWWSELDSAGEKLVSIKKLSKYLTDKNFFSNIHEARNYILEIKKPIGESLITRDHFDRLFAKAILKGALKNIAYGLNTGEFAGDEQPLRMKIAMYQRRLMLNGMKPVGGSLKKDGKQVLKALYSYTKDDGDVEQLEDIIRNINSKSVKDERKQVAMEQHKERTIDYLFAIKESAAVYLDKFGVLSVDFSKPIAVQSSETDSDLESDLSFSRKSSRISQKPRASGNRSPPRRRISPIKDPVRRTTSLPDSQKSKGRAKTLAITLVKKAIELQNREKCEKPKYFKYLKKTPYPRNVRMFRDNYLYKSYQQAILKNADI